MSEKGKNYRTKAIRKEKETNHCRGSGINLPREDSHGRNRRDIRTIGAIRSWD